MNITAQWVFPVSSDPIRRATLFVENGRIEHIRPASASDCPADTCLIPGLVNAHTHLAYTAVRNAFDHLSFFAWLRKLTAIKEDPLTREDMAKSTQLGIFETLRSGITAVADMSDQEVALEVLAKSPIRGRFFWEVFGVEKEAADATMKDLPGRLQYLRERYETKRLQIGVSPHACFTVRPELYKQIARWALRENIPISFHVAESRAEEDFIARREGAIAEFLQFRAADWQLLGKSSIQHLDQTGIFETRPLVAHAVQACDEDLDVLAKKQVPVAYCPKSNAKFGHGIAPIDQMLKKGIRVAIGTDSAASNNGLDLLEEGRFGMLQQRSLYRRPVLTPQKVLEMMTLDGAKALAMEDQIGSLEKGKQADFVLIRVPSDYDSADQVLNHLIYNSSHADVLKTYIAGEEVAVDRPDVSTIYKKLR